MGSITQNKLVVLVGPTCTGKTSLAQKIKEDIYAEIISADSRQVYKLMDYGTGKADKFGTVVKVFWGYDLVNPSEKFSAYEYAKAGQHMIEQIYQSERLPIVVGGTGLYIDSIVGKLTFDYPKPSDEFRAKLNSLSLNDLVKILRDINPTPAESIDLKNPVRVIREIEKETFGRKSKQSILKQYSNPIYIGLNGDRSLLYERADKWLDSVWSNILQETRHLIDLGYGDYKPMQSLIYKSAVSAINGNVSIDDAKQLAKYDTHAYIRRQLTWFKRNPQIKWFDISDPNFSVNVLGYLREFGMK